MTRALIIEDEDLSARRLIRLLDEGGHGIKVVGRLESIKETLLFLIERKEEVDLIFLDVHLADGNIFEVLNKIEIGIPIIFTTGFDKYALDAFRQRSVDYLMKPIQAEDLNRSVAKYNIIFGKEINPNQHEIVKLFASQTGYKKRFLVYVGAKIRTIGVENIITFYAENKACFLMNDLGRSYDIDYTLEKLEKILEPDQFFRLNRKIIVHLENIEEVIPYSKSRHEVRLKQTPGFDVFISAARIKEFKAWLNK